MQNHYPNTYSPLTLPHLDLRTKLKLTRVFPLASFTVRSHQNRETDVLFQYLVRTEGNICMQCCITLSALDFAHIIFIFLDNHIHHSARLPPCISSLHAQLKLARESTRTVTRSVRKASTSATIAPARFSCYTDISAKDTQTGQWFTWMHM